MKIESVKKFTPVVITLESQDEVDKLCCALRCSLATQVCGVTYEYSHALSRWILEKLDL